MTTAAKPATSVGPDGNPFPFGQIIEVYRIGPYAVTRYISNRDGGMLYGSYVMGEEVSAEGWNERAGLRRTGHSHRSLDAALTFLVAYRAAGPNVASHVATHYLRGLGVAPDA